MTVPLIVIGAIALLLFLLLASRMRLLIVANEQTAKVELRVLFLHLTLYPKPPKTRLRDVKRARRKAARKAKRNASKVPRALHISSHLALLDGQPLCQKIRTA